MDFPFQPWEMSETEKMQQPVDFRYPYDMEVVTCGSPDYNTELKVVLFIFIIVPRKHASVAPMRNGATSGGWRAIFGKQNTFAVILSELEPLTEFTFLGGETLSI